MSTKKHKEAVRAAVAKLKAITLEDEHRDAVLLLERSYGELRREMSRLKTELEQCKQRQPVASPSPSPVENDLRYQIRILKGKLAKAYADMAIESFDDLLDGLRTLISGKNPAEAGLVLFKLHMIVVLIISPRQSIFDHAASLRDWWLSEFAPECDGEVGDYYQSDLFVEQMQDLVICTEEMECPLF